jgi:hypothetical protein
MENNHDVNGESLEDVIGGGIFTDKGEQTEALRKSAEALGLNPDLVAPEEDGPQFRYYARKGCKHCFGQGILNVCLSPSKRKVFWKNERKSTRVSFRQTKTARSRRIGPTRPVIKKITGFSDGNELGESWDTRRPEPRDYKKENTSQSFCRCIRAVEV